MVMTDRQRKKKGGSGISILGREANVIITLLFRFVLGGRLATVHWVVSRFSNVS